MIGVFGKRKQSSWGSTIAKKCEINKEEYQRIHQMSPSLPKLIANVAWTRIKIWDITRKKKGDVEYRPLSKKELIE